MIKTFRNNPREKYSIEDIIRIINNGIAKLPLLQYIKQYFNSIPNNDIQKYFEFPRFEYIKNQVHFILPFYVYILIFQIGFVN